VGIFEIETEDEDDDENKRRMRPVGFTEKWPNGQVFGLTIPVPDVDNGAVGRGYAPLR
jgi:hypothetical protein